MMVFSSRMVVLALTSLLCLLTQGLGAKLPQEIQDEDMEPRTIDQILMKAEKMSEEGSDPFYFTQHTNMIRTELDIIYTVEEYMAMKHNRQKRTAAIRFKEGEERWTDNTVNFELQQGFGARDLLEIKKAMKEISHYTCLKFNETSEAKNRVFIQRGFGGCYSRVGMVGGKQDLGLGNGCRSKQVIIHELLHAIGMHHEQSRPDRDEHLLIQFEHVHPSRQSNFVVYTWDYINTYNISYDYNSVMHYGKTVFSYTGYDTIVTKDPKYQDIIGTNPGLSIGDIKTLNLMYSCVPDSCKLTDADCGENGFVGKDCKCWCPGPKRQHPVEYCFEKDIEEKGSLDIKHDCRDYSSYCEGYARDGWCSEAQVALWLMYNCEKSCKIC